MVSCNIPFPCRHKRHRFELFEYPGTISALAILVRVFQLFPFSIPINNSKAPYRSYVLHFWKILYGCNIAVSILLQQVQDMLVAWLLWFLGKLGIYILHSLLGNYRSLDYCLSFCSFMLVSIWAFFCQDNCRIFFIIWRTFSMHP